MKTNILLGLAILGAALAAQGATPTDQSVAELLDVSRMDKTVDQMMTQMDAGMKNAVQQSMRGRTLTAEQQAAANKLSTDMSAIVHEEVSLAKLKPVYVKVYKDTFTQEEVDGLIAFYKSPIGKSYVDKLPLVMQRSGAAMQERMAPIMQKLTSLQNDFMRDLSKAPSPKP